MQEQSTMTLRELEWVYLLLPLCAGEREGEEMGRLSDCLIVFVGGSDVS